jgi:hypothetical protein
LHSSEGTRGGPEDSFLHLQSILKNKIHIINPESQTQFELQATSLIHSM